MAYPAYGASSSRNRTWVRSDGAGGGAGPHDEASAYNYGGYDAYHRQHQHQQQAAYRPEYADAYRSGDEYYGYASVGGAYGGEYGGNGRGGGYAWQDAYGYAQVQAQAQGYDNGGNGGAWNGYDAQRYQDPYPYPHYPQQYGYETSAPRYAYEAHASAAAAVPPSNRVWSSAKSGLKGVKGAPAAPKAMRDNSAAPSSQDAHFATPAGAASQASAHAYKYNGFHQQQTRDYHGYKGAGSGHSRFQPYQRNSAPGTPMHPSNRPVPVQRQPPAVRAAPRPAYIEQAKQASRQLSEEEAQDRKLLVVLDLNGTLVFRAKSSDGRAKDSIRAVPRPFLLCFLQYCLGIATDAASKGKQVEAANRPHGSQFWSSEEDGCVHEPRSAGKAEVVVWSSAQPFNVDSMVRASFDPSVRSQILRVWARDTLVPQRFYQSKADSVKDLEIVWAELNAFSAGQPSLNRLLAQARDQADQLRPDDVPPPSAPTAPAADKKYKGKKHKEKMKLQKQQQQEQQQQQQQEYVSAAQEAAKLAQEWGPWGPENTVLVDDSVKKARLHPWNHLLIPEFGKEDAGRMKKFIRQQHASTAGEGTGEAGDDAVGEAELESDSDLSVHEPVVAPTADVAQTHGEVETVYTVDTVDAVDAGDASTTAEQTQTVDEDAVDDVKPNKKPIPESRLDDVLLQTIGVLETLRYQSNVSAFIHAGGIAGYGQPKTAFSNQQQRSALIQQGATPEFWADKGREVCGKLGIEVKAWFAGDAASATAALL